MSFLFIVLKQCTLIFKQQTTNPAEVCLHSARESSSAEAEVGEFGEGNVPSTRDDKRMAEASVVYGTM